MSVCEPQPERLCGLVEDPFTVGTIGIGLTVTVGVTLADIQPLLEFDIYAVTVVVCAEVNPELSVNIPVILPVPDAAILPAAGRLVVLLRLQL